MYSVNVRGYVREMSFSSILQTAKVYTKTPSMSRVIFGFLFRAVVRRPTSSDSIQIFNDDIYQRTQHLQQLIFNAHCSDVYYNSLCVVKTEINTNRTSINNTKIAETKPVKENKLTFVMRCWLQKAEMTLVVLQSFNYY